MSPVSRRSIRDRVLCSALTLSALVLCPAVEAQTDISELRRSGEGSVRDGDYDRAESMFKQELEAASKLKDDGAQRAVALDDYAAFCEFRDRHDEAFQMYDEALKIRRKVLWDEHPDVALNLLNLAHAEVLTRQFPEAGDHYIEVLDKHKGVLARGAEHVFVDCVKVATMLGKQWKFPKCEHLYKSALAAAMTSETRQRPTLMMRLGHVLATQGKNVEAAKYYKQALAYLDKYQPWNDQRRAIAVKRLETRLKELPAEDQPLPKGFQSISGDDD